MTSSHFIQKKQEEVLTKVNKTRIVENIILDEDGKEISEEEYSEIVIAHPFVDGMVYDEVIETKLSGRLAYEKEKIISWEKSQEKKEEVKRLQDQHQKETKEYLKNRPSEIRELLGRLSSERGGLVLLEESTKEIDVRISALKTEYGELKNSNP